MRSRGAALASVGEFRLIDRLCRNLRLGRDVELGPGDDCAIVRIGKERLLLTTDALVEGVHFLRGRESPRRLGERAFVVNASDVAAMGGRPLWALLAIGAPPRGSARELESLTAGFAAAARKAGASLVGGNLARGERWSITVALVGSSPARPLRRDGALVGDLVCVSGTLGGAAHALHRRGPRPMPIARVALGERLANSGLARSAIDVSDGLLQDLGHVCRASGVGADLDAAAVPLAPSLRRSPRDRALRLALTGGEDYELLFTVDPRRRRVIARLGATVIGRIVARRSIRVLDEAGRAMPIARRGFDHFGGDA